MPIQEFKCLLCGSLKYQDAATVRSLNVVCVPCHAFMDRTQVLPDNAPVAASKASKEGNK